MSRSPAVILFDTAGNSLVLEVDGVLYRVPVAAKLAPGTDVVGGVQLVAPDGSTPMGDAAEPLRVDPTGDTVQPVSASALPLPSGASTEATAAAILAALATLATDAEQQATTAAAGVTAANVAAQTTALTSALASLATEATAGDILAKLSSDPATDATLVAILSALARLDDLATEATATAILAKISSDPATETTLAAVAAALVDAATETTLAAALSALTLIKDVDGIKKITDALPAGTNRIGGVTVRGNTAVNTAERAARILEHGRARDNEQSAPLTAGAVQACTLDSGTNTITAAAHGIPDGARVAVASDTDLPVGLSDSTAYFAVNATTNTLQIATTEGGTPVAFGAGGLGSYTVQERGEYVGTFLDVRQAGSVIWLYATFAVPTFEMVPLSVVIEWSDDGIAPNSEVLGTTEIPIRTTGIPATLAAISLETSVAMVGDYARLRVVGGASTQPAGTWLAGVFVGRDSYTGQFGEPDADLTELTTLLGVRSVNVGLDPDGDYKNLRASGRHTAGSTRGRLLADASTTSGSLYLDSAGAAFTSSDMGRPIEGDGIPAETTIAAVISATKVRLSAAATATAVGVSVKIGTVLDAGGVWRGEWLFWQGEFVEMITEVTASADGVLFFDFADAEEPVNGTDESVSPPSVSYAYTAGQGLRPRHTPVQSRWVRARFVNNATTAQTAFSVDVAYLVAPTSGVFQPLDTPPNGRQIVQATQSIAFAEASESPGTFAPVQSIAGGMPATVIQHDVATPIEPVAIPRTGRATVNSATVTPLPPFPLADRVAVRFKNLGDTPIDFSEDPAKIPDGADQLGGGEPIVFDLGPGAAAQLYFRAEPGGAPTTNVVELSVDTVDSNSGVTDPANMFAADGAVAVFDDSADTCELSGFDSTPIALPDIVSVILKARARRAATPTVDAVAFVDAVTAEATNPASITATGVAADATSVYLIAVSYRKVAAEITSVVSTMGFASFALIRDAGQAGGARTQVFRAVGAPVGAGNITATFDTAAAYATISVSRWSGCDLAAPVTASDAIDVPDTASSYSSSVAGVVGGRVVVVSGTEVISLSSVGAGSINVPTFGSASSKHNRQSIASQPITVGGSQAYSGTYSGTNDRAVVAVALAPGVPAAPVLGVSYEVSGVPGATALSESLDSDSLTEYSADITTDRPTWTTADLDLVHPIPTAQIGIRNAEVDRIWLEVTESTGVKFSVLSWTEIGGRP